MTVAETIGLYQELADAARAWARANAQFARAVTSPAYTGRETSAARERLDDATRALATVVERLDDASLPELAGTIEAARDVTKLEGEIVLSAIAFTRATDAHDDAVDADAAKAALLRVALHETSLRTRTYQLLARLADLAAKAAA